MNKITPIGGGNGVDRSDPRCKESYLEESAYELGCTATILFFNHDGPQNRSSIKFQVSFKRIDQMVLFSIQMKRLKRMWSKVGKTIGHYIGRWRGLSCNASIEIIVGIDELVSEMILTKFKMMWDCYKEAHLHYCREYLGVTWDWGKFQHRLYLHSSDSVAEYAPRCSSPYLES
ncbi:hypothetical protein Tco_1191497 [Tanacetum coccineum]